MNVFAGKRGFTLIELLVVIAIIGLLSSVVLASLNTARAKGRDAQRESSIEQMRTALELYYSDNGTYPTSGGASAPNGGWSTSNDSSWATLQTKLAPYMASLPKDPAQSSSGWPGTAGVYAYSYYSVSSCGDWYMIVWQAEGTNVASPGTHNACSGTPYQYGGSTHGGIITVGSD